MLEFCDVVLATGQCGLEDCPDNHDTFLLCISCLNIATSLDAAKVHRMAPEHRRIAARMASHCSLCSEDLKGDWASHCKSKRHAKAAERSPNWSDPLFPVYKEVAGTVAGHVRCATCRVDISGKEWNQHCSSPDHSSKSSMAAVLQKFTRPVSTWHQDVSQDKGSSRHKEQETQVPAEVHHGPAQITQNTIDSE